MKLLVDDWSYFVGLGGPAKVEQEQATEADEVVTVKAAEALFRAFQAERWEKELNLDRLLN